MINSMLQWHDARTEKPTQGETFFVALFDEEHPCVATFFENTDCVIECGQRCSSWGSVDYWAALMTTECVRQKFRDERLRNDEKTGMQ